TMSLPSLKDYITKTDNFEEKIASIAKYAKDITGAERCSLFVFDQDKNQLQSIYNDGIKGHLIMNSNMGIVGYAFHKRISILENHTEQNSSFFKKVDKKLNYHTKNILAVPIIDSHNKRLGAIELLNKEEGFSKQDQVSIEELPALIVTVLDSSIHHTTPKEEPQSKKTLTLKDLQNKFDHYLTNKRLFLEDDGNAYYKILNMKREYFISASICYTLDDTPKKIKIYYYSVTGEFLSVDMHIKIHEETKGLQVSERITTPKFTCYPLEEDA
ncbi:MAG: GAF domain-containing protein, partial [Sulfurovum sp.]|nr:GAF domain-containing protein [Sulfurovum sp.]NNJ45160.1 GAF domain-containing protein [Sulfurovum sp.]